MIGHELNILVVDDNDTNLFLMKALLEAICPEARVCQSRNGDEALRDFIAWRPDLILMDVQMPVRDGLEATRAIRVCEGGATVPVIACTASVLPQDIGECLASGMDDVLAKPVAKADLENILAKWLPRG